MARLKILLDEPRAMEERSRESGKFYKQLDAVLRKSSAGREWAVQGAGRTVQDESGRVYRRRVYLCEVTDVDERWPLVKELIQRYDLQARTTAYREEDLHEGWERVWPSDSDSA